MKLKELIAEGKLDFDGWTSLILEVESSCAVSSFILLLFAVCSFLK